MQPLYEGKWTSTLDKELPSNNLSTKLEDDFDIGPTWAYRDIFSKSIEKFKDASTMKLCYTIFLVFLIQRNNIKVESLKEIFNPILL
jgi:hypothetical protein